MYFFQDDIGLLVQHARYNLWQWIITPQAEHFAPLLHALTFLEFKLFHLNFYGYFFTSLLLHALNLFILYSILRLLKINKNLSLLVSSLFLINLTFVEPFLWFSAQGVILANIFIALAFYFWLRKSHMVFIMFFAASFSYSTGLGLGIIFGIINLIHRQFTPALFLIGIFSIIIGPLVAGNSLGQITPVIRNPLYDFLLFSAFIIGGVGRGVIGRLFLPGFEPRHFEIIKTLISFIPFAVISAVILKNIQTGQKQLSRLLISLCLLIIYPYVWAGSIRFHFGIKQALAERYAYTPLFFSLIIIGLLLKYFLDKKMLFSKNKLAVIFFILLIFQSVNFYNKAVEFEKRPIQTKKYIDDLKSKIKNNEMIIDESLPDFINQPLKISDLYPLLNLNSK